MSATEHIRDKEDEGDRMWMDLPIVVGRLELCWNIQFWSVDIEAQIEDRERHD